MIYTEEQVQILKRDVAGSRAGDLTGMKYGKLTIMYLGPKSRQGAQWFCKCDCGNWTLVRQSNIINQHTKSCGCLRKQGRQQQKK